MKLSTTSVKFFCGAMLMMMPFSVVNARHLTPEEALKRAEGKSTAMHMPANLSYDLVYSETNEGQEFVYVFNKGDKGFVVVSADDSMPALLGYSDNGGFDYEYAAPALKWWLRQYAEEASSASETIALQTLYNYSQKKTSEKADRTPIPYLIQTKWDQEFPYNLNCPDKKEKKCVTGCVATAMAQIMRYHGYPQSGNGTHSYQWNDTILSYDYEKADFRFDDMPDIYSGSETEERNQAVANLMYACGVAVNMDYNLNTPGSTIENGSTTSDMYIPYALRNFFKYDNAVRYLKKAFYASDKWEDLLYSELAAGRPVIYGGQDSRREGHQFICDGYEGNGYYHINWGWSGHGDGNFLLSALDPKFHGAGGAGGPYNSNQTMICGIQPPVNNSKVWYPIYSSGGILASPFTDSAVEISFSKGCGILNYSPEAVDVIFEIKAVSQDGKEYVSNNHKSLSFKGADGVSIGGYNSIGSVGLPENLPAGDYKCYLAFKTHEGNIQDVLFPYTATAYFNLNVNNKGEITCSPGEPDAKTEIRVTKFDVATEVTSGEETTVHMKIENIGEIEYSGIINMKIFNQNSDKDIITYRISLNTLAPNDDFEINVNLKFNLDPGVYDVIFFDQYNQKISDVFTLTVGDSGIDSLISGSELVDIYSAGGVLLMKNSDKTSVSSLPKGIYILNINGKSYKVIK